jgi:hypothetical protein
MSRCKLVVAWLMLLVGCAFASLAGATTYYVDSVGGNDNNNGTSTGTAWQNLTKVNTITFAARRGMGSSCTPKVRGPRATPFW